MTKENKPYLIIYPEKSVLNDTDGNVYEYSEGKLSSDAKKRLNQIKKELEEGFLENLIKECFSPDVNIGDISKEHKKHIETLVDSVTSEVGRAIVGLTVLQLTIKSIDKKQSVRLHKGSNGSGAFSWQEGIPMRVLDKNFITPVLRKFDLLRLNADGFMMTRSLAENYPYSKLYKAAIRGAREEWLTITDLAEGESFDSKVALKYLITQLINKSADFNAKAEALIILKAEYISQNKSFQDTFKTIVDYINSSTYSARIFEISIHSLFQAIDSKKCFPGYLVPLSQMRSANKKHGNIGDIELSYSKGGSDIIESWDAKYGKTYLRDELEELNDKLKFHPIAEIVGFITDSDPNLKTEITDRIKELEDIHSVKIEILNFKDWVNKQIEKYELDSDEIAKLWLNALVESICLKRREIAPIDEPSSVWIDELMKILE
jgi:hypothetical protein